MPINLKFLAAHPFVKINNRYNLCCSSQMGKKIILGIELVTVINELNQGREFTKHLQNHLGPLSSLELCDLLIQKILSSYEKAISLLNGEDLVREIQIDGILETSQALSGSNPMSEVSKDVYKKRKTSPQQAEQVHIYSGTGLRLLDDGFSWRKYGQKDIVGANFPRSYYRCTYHRAQGCMATKQVQNSDEDPSILKITYKGRHTCNQASQLSPQLASVPKNDPQQNQYQVEGNQNLSQETIVEFGTNPKIKTDELGFMDETVMPVSFSLPPTSIEFQNMETNTYQEEKNILGSETYWFPMLQSQNLQLSEANLYEAISAPTPVSNLSVRGLDFSSDLEGFDPNFMFGASEFLF
ncbi:probable WRKY transcription factor 30 [Actinidia eriantha]|uniref:probable WRKY transcription factor 30 n=1 Tax=Actinidia eriantha TaxID=165200 RepID=UPI00258CC78F|nr:probable WRKY transcription factor 30 [Actinidia eriantha]